MRILFANHTGAWSGAEVSLMRLVQTLGTEHDLCVACPAEGPLADQLDGAGLDRIPLPAVDASLRLHPVQTPIGIGQLAAAGVGLARAAKRFRAEVIHANSPRAGIMGALALPLGGPPFVVRAHEHVPLTPVGRAVRALLVRTASAVAAVSDYTAERFNEGLEPPVATRVYNSIDHARFDAERVRSSGVREELGISPDAALLGQVAQITPWKAQDTAIRAVAELRRGRLDAHLLLVGQIAFGGKGVRYDNHAYLAELERLASDLGVGDAVHFLGQRRDVPEILHELDLSLLPSRGEPFGLVTVESMAIGTPPLVSSEGAGPELVQDGLTGRVLPPGPHDAWAWAARELLQDREALRRMGEYGRVAAEAFRDEVYAREMLTIYERAAGMPTRGPGTARPVATTSRSDDRVEATWPS
jgi:glycosyltransferase involved in cell wall biosynthesis